MSKENLSNRMQFTEILETIESSDARTSTIISASFLDEMLRGVLKYNFIRISSKLEAEIFEGNGPLSSFANRTNVAYAMGLISSKVRDDLVVIRRLRNEYAHRLTKAAIAELDFKHGVIKLHAATDCDSTLQACRLLRLAVHALSLYLIMRTAPPSMIVDKDLESNLSQLDYSNVLPEKLRGV